MFEIGAILDEKYQVQALLGTGGMGVVYRVLNLETNRDVALKVLNATADQKDVQRRFRREFQVLSTLRHPRVIRTFSWGVAEDHPYFTMAYLPGKTLGKITANQELLDQFRAAHFSELAQQIADGLAYLHAQGMVHRDLKPSNIMVLETKEGIETTILDMGLAKFKHSHSVSLTQAGSTIGTAEYMSPEQGKGMWVDHRSDLYALGVILYELLVGAPPFSGQSPISVIFKHIRELPPPLREVNLSVSTHLQQVVMKLLEKEPVDRYQSAEDVIRALKDVDAPAVSTPSISDIPPSVPKHVMHPQFVGREAEMKMLHAMLTDVQQGQQRAVLVSGAFGVGKSRLVEELLGDALVHGFLCLKGECREAGRRLFGPLVDALQQVKREHLPVPLADHDGPDWQKDLFLNKRDQDKFGAMERLLVFMKNLRQKQPVVLCVEDIQWIDELTLEFLQYMLRDPEPCALLLCLTCRQGKEEPVAKEIELFVHGKAFRQVTQLPLENLQYDDVGHLVASMLGAQSVPPDALQALLRETGGQPLFVIEAVRMLVNTQVIQKNVSGQWQWGAFPETLLTDDMVGILQKRVGMLPSVQRRVLEYASVFLNDFSFELLATVWRGDELDLLDTLEDLIDMGILTRLGDDDERYRFSQGVYRRAIYDHLHKARRRLLHREIGNALEAMGQTEDLADELADHFVAAGEKAKAFKYLKIAGKQALDSRAYRQSFLRLDMAMAYKPESINSPNEAADEIDFLCNYVDMARRQELHDKVLDILEEAEALVPDGRNDLQARILLLRGNIYSTLYYRSDLAEKSIKEAHGLYRELSDCEGEIEALGSLSYLYDVTARHKNAADCYRQFIEKQRILDDSADNQRIIKILELHLALMEFRFERAKVHIESAAELFDPFQDQQRCIQLIEMLPRVYFYMGDLERAEATCEEALAVWQKRGVVYWEAYVLLWFGELALERGDFSEALEYAKSSMERFLNTPRRDYIYRAYAIAATAAAKMGEIETALEWVEKAREGTQQTSGMYTGMLPLVWCGIGAALAAAGRTAEAGEAFVQAIECRKESKGDPWARALLMAGEFYVEHNDMPKARAHLEAAACAFKEMEMPYFLKQTQALLDRLDSPAPQVSVSSLAVDTLSADRLRLLYDVSQELTTELDANALLDRVFGKLLTVCPGERALVAVKDETKTGFVVDVVRHHNVETDAVEELSRGIIRQVIKKNEPILSLDAQVDQSLNRYQSVMDYHIRSVLCVPITQFQEGVIGALYVDHHGIGQAFTESDQTFLQAFANLVAVALVNAKVYARLQEKARYLQLQVERRHQLGDLVGHSDAMQKIYHFIERAARSDVPVLVLGETGTGKELAARAIHYNSARKDRPFLSQNCASLSPELLQSELFGHQKGAFTGAIADHVGIFEAADGGTVFLDEIGDASPQVQTSLLRVLQEGEVRRVGETVDRAVDVRIVAATNRDLAHEVECGRFREDLYYRLHVIQIDMPPLRKHIEDVPLLAEGLLSRTKEDANRPVGALTVGAIQALTRYGWPGNVRELENEIRRAVALVEEGGDITPDLFSEPIGGGVASQPSDKYGGYLKARVEAFEKQVILDVLEKHEGNITHAAEELGLTRNGLQKKMDRLGMR